MYTVYGRSQPTCSACEGAKSILDLNGLEYEYIDVVTNNINAKDLEARAGRPLRTVPVIFKGNEFIGGRDDLVRKLSEAKGL